MVSGMWKWKWLRFAAFAAFGLALAACGGGGGDRAAPSTPPVDGGAPPTMPPPDGGETPSPPPALSDAEIEQVREDPAVVRLGEILAGADALLLTGLRSRYSLEGGGETLDEEESHDAFTCEGASCVAGDGTRITTADLTGSAADLGVSLSEATLGARGGFDTADTQGSLEVAESAAGVRVTAEPTVRAYGFWGAHGYAALELGEGPLTGSVDGTAFTGEFSFARAYAAGAASGTNPAGPGGATWSGVVEASPAGEFERLQGSVTLTIADLSNPRVGVSVDVTGHEIDRPGWADVPLADGRFTAGTVGDDYIGGFFGGPGHEEAWGVFDTTGYLGAFGAKRQP